jgi:hypothetical protein
MALGQPPLLVRRLLREPSPGRTDELDLVDRRHEAVTGCSQFCNLPEPLY